MSNKSDIRRVVTGHNAEGRAHIRSDETFAPKPIPSGNADFALLWTTTTMPANNNDETDGRLREAGLTLQQGSVIRVVDMLPGGTSPMHESNRIAYGIVISGEVELELDDGEKAVLGAGDICIQRGTIHLWRTVGDEPCRIVFVLTQATAYEHEGIALPEIQP